MATTEPTARLCGKCGQNEPGPGGILCPGCRAVIEARMYPSQNEALREELDRAAGRKP